MVITGALVATGVTYGFCIAAGFKAYGRVEAYLGHQYTKLVQRIQGSVQRTMTGILVRYSPVINHFKIVGRSADNLLKRLVDRIVRGLMRLYGKYGIGLSAAEMDNKVDTSIRDAAWQVFDTKYSMAV